MKASQNAIKGLSATFKKLILIFIITIVSVTSHDFAHSAHSGSVSARGPSGKQPVGTVRFSISQLVGTYYFKLAEMLYTEAFARLGYGFELYAFPPERALLESNSGRMDGEAGRIRFDTVLSDQYPNLIRVTEPVAVLHFCAYTADAAIHLNGWQGLEGRKLVIGYARGTKIAEKKLFDHVDSKYLFEVTDNRQGLRMLRLGRIDVMAATQASVESILAEPEFKDSGISLAGILEVVPAFPYLHKKHSALAPRMAAALKAMKKDGTFDRLLEEAKSEAAPYVNQ